MIPAMASVSTGISEAPRANAPAATVLVVDDEDAIRDLVAMTLRYEGFEVVTAATGIDAVALAEERRPDVVLLDIMLPDIDGHEVLRRMSAAGDRAPILFLTARDAPEDRVRGLTLGADDYICKPFSIAELIARVHVALRRSRTATQPRRLEFADLTLDEDSFEVTRAGVPVSLTATEFKLLRYLMLNPRRVLSKQQILDYVWDYDFEGDPNVVETYISYLRKKVDRFPPPLIHTVRGFGYALRIAQERA
jgi:two-component system OmpR family response regulator